MFSALTFADHPSQCSPLLALPSDLLRDLLLLAYQQGPNVFRTHICGSSLPMFSASCSSLRSPSGSLAFSIPTRTKCVPHSHLRIIPPNVLRFLLIPPISFGISCF